MAFEKKAYKEAREKALAEGKTAQEAEVIVDALKAADNASGTSVNDPDNDGEGVPTATAAAVTKTVQVMGIDDHDCTIGNVRYFIENQKTQRVPEDVAMILQNSRIAIRVNG